MAVNSSKDIKKGRVVSPVLKENDNLNENILRPKALKDYVGQEKIKRHLAVSIESSKIRKAPLEHILFYGPPGLGKTTLSQIIALEKGSNIKITSGPAIEKQSDLISILSNLEENDILFIDEIHRLRPQIEEILYTAMEDFVIDMMVGKGTGASNVRMPLPPFTLIGATTRLSSLSAPLRDRFGNILKLDFYEDKELGKIIENNSKKLGFSLGNEIFSAIGERSRGTPRIANRLLKVVRDYKTIGRNIEEKVEIESIFSDLGVDEKGLDVLDRKYLGAILYKFGCGPVGLNTLAGTLGEEEDTIEDVVEPYLMQIGFMERTPRGRKITKLGEEHIYKIDNN